MSRYVGWHTTDRHMPSLLSKAGQSNFAKTSLALALPWYQDPLRPAHQHINAKADHADKNDP